MKVLIFSILASSFLVAVCVIGNYGVQALQNTVNQMMNTGTYSENIDDVMASIHNILQ